MGPSFLVSEKQPSSLEDGKQSLGEGKRTTILIQTIITLPKVLISLNFNYLDVFLTNCGLLDCLVCCVDKTSSFLNRRSLPDRVGQLLVLDLRTEEVRVGWLVAHGGGERAEDCVQELKNLVLVHALPAVSQRLTQRALHGHQKRGDVDEAAHLAEHRPSAVTLSQHG